MTGADLRAARISAGISLRALARRIGISPSYLSDLERGFRTSQRMLAIARSELRLMVAEQKARRKEQGR
jgi:transcriptional regulator with XRE-family HTH domain